MKKTIPTPQDGGGDEETAGLRIMEEGFAVAHAIRPAKQKQRRRRKKT